MYNNWISLFVAVVVVSLLSGCGNSAPAPAQSSNANLENIVLSDGNFDQAFDRDTTLYTVTVSNDVSSISLLPAVEDPGAKVSINGSVVVSGQSSDQIPVAVGDNSISVVVTAADNATRKIYIFSVTRLSSSNARLSSLTLSSGSIGGFVPDQLTYDVNVNADVSEITVTATPENSDAKLSINGVSTLAGVPSHKVALTQGDTKTILVKVTAQDASSDKTYTLNVTRLTQAASNPGSVNLSNLAVSAGSLSPVFSSAQTSYDVTVTNSVSSLRITATLADQTSTLQVAGVITVSGSISPAIPLNTGLNSFEVIVTSFDNSLTNTYVLNVLREPSTVSTLNNLVVSGVGLDQVFASDLLSYTATVSYSMSSITITPMLKDKAAAITINSQPVNDGQAMTLGLSVGNNGISIRVTAEDGTSITDYVLNVTRETGDNAKLSQLTLSNGTLTPGFDPSLTTYTVEVPNSVTSFSMTPVLQDTGATLTINGSSTPSGAVYGPLALSAGDNTFNLNVTSENNSTVKIYTVTVTRYRNEPIFTSSNNFSIDEGNTSVTTITASHDAGSTVTFSLAGGVDDAFFSINNSTGDLTFNSAPDAENALDNNNDGSYEIIVRATAIVDSMVYHTDLSVSVNVNDVDEPPVITSSALLSVAENQTMIATLTASDPENATLTFTISGGQDQAFFNLTSSGTLTFLAPKDYEAPEDMGANNGYDVEVTVDDGGLSASQLFTVVVTDVVEVPASGPTVNMSYGLKTLQFSWSTVTSATYYQLWENPDGSSGYTKVVDNISATNVDHVIPLHQRINASYIMSACNSAGCTDSGEVFLVGDMVNAVGYVKASNTDGSNSSYNDYFGYALSLSDDGNTLAVGAYREDSNGTGINSNTQDNNSAGDSGAVYVYSYDAVANSWSQQAYVKASKLVGSFGLSVALSSDGNTMAVGTLSNEVYIFTRSGTTWSQQDFFTGSNAGSGDRFGEYLDISGDGDTVVVGARYEDSNGVGINPATQSDNSLTDSGAVYVFKRSGASWSQQAYIKGSSPSFRGEFGRTVSLSYDGNTMAVGSYATNAVYVFERIGGVAWTEQTTMSAAYIGQSVSLSGDGNTLAISSTNGFYVHVRNAVDSSWSEQTHITTTYLGYAVSISKDATVLAVHAKAGGFDGVSDASNFGSISHSGDAIMTYEFDGSNWIPKALLKASNASNAGSYANDNAVSFDISQDGSSIAVGAQSENSIGTGINSNMQWDTSAPGAGAAYLY